MLKRMVATGAIAAAVLAPAAAANASTTDASTGATGAVIQTTHWWGDGFWGDCWGDDFFFWGW
jgi:hypothetical protein